MFTIRTPLLLLLTLNLISFNALALDSYKEEIRKLTMKNHRPLDSYSYARQVIMQEVHLQKDNQGYFIEDVYCHEDFRKNVGPHRMPNHNEINIEHTWPQSRFSYRASKSIQKSDLHHLYPSDSRANSIRGNFYFSELSNQDTIEGCMDSKQGYDPELGETTFEPPADHKGNVARALFYFSLRYRIEITPHEEALLREWNKEDPVDAAERRRNDIIESFQGNRNPFIDDPEYADLIQDF